MVKAGSVWGNSLGTFYDVLQVKAGSDERTVRDSYLYLMSVYHPDRFAGDEKFAHFHASRINEAYRILGNPAKRADYDAALAAHNRSGLSRAIDGAGYWMADRAGRVRAGMAASTARVRQARQQEAVDLAGQAGAADSRHEAAPSATFQARLESWLLPIGTAYGRVARAGVSPLWLLLIVPLLALFIIVPGPGSSDGSSDLAAASPPAPETVAAPAAELGRPRPSPTTGGRAIA